MLNVVSFARFSTRQAVIDSAIFSFSTTVFTCIIISITSLSFVSDTENIIVKPITKMVGLIITFVDDPLRMPIPPNLNANDPKDTTTKYIKTDELEKTIFKTGTLLQMSLGNLGASIIRENVILLTTSSNDNSLKIMKAGHRINAIFMVWRIKYYEAILEWLEEDAIVYINKVVKIVHEWVNRWDGAVNKNEGDLYLITWKLPNVEESENERNENLQEMKTELADKSLISAIKVIAELRRSGDLKYYYKNPRFSKVT